MFSWCSMRFSLLVRVIILLNQHSMTLATEILANLPAGCDLLHAGNIKFIRSDCRHFRHCGKPWNIFEVWRGEGFY